MKERPMKQSLTFLAAVMTFSFAIGALAGHAQAAGIELEIIPQTNDELAIPAEPIPADPDVDMPMIYNLIEPSETLTDMPVLYAV